VVPDDAQARAAANQIARFDTVLFGRRTYDNLLRSGRASSPTANPTRCPIPIIPDDGLASIAQWLSRWTR